MELIFLLVYLVPFAWAWAGILSKAGYSSGYAIFMVIPGVQLIGFFMFAFSDWPCLRFENRLLPEEEQANEEFAKIAFSHAQSLKQDGRHAEAVDLLEEAVERLLPYR